MFTIKESNNSYCTIIATARFIKHTHCFHNKIYELMQSWSRTSSCMPILSLKNMLLSQGMLSFTSKYSNTVKPRKMAHINGGWSTIPCQKTCQHVTQHKCSSEGAITSNNIHRNLFIRNCLINLSQMSYVLQNIWILKISLFSDNEGKAKMYGPDMPDRTSYVYFKWQIAPQEKTLNLLKNCKCSP